MAIVYKHMKNTMLFSVDYNQSTSNKTFSLKTEIFLKPSKESHVVFYYINFVFMKKK